MPVEKHEVMSPWLKVNSMLSMCWCQGSLDFLGETNPKQVKYIYLAILLQFCANQEQLLVGRKQWLKEIVDSFLEGKRGFRELWERSQNPKMPELTLNQHGEVCVHQPPSCGSHPQTFQRNVIKGSENPLEISTSSPDESYAIGVFFIIFHKKAAEVFL